MLIITKKLLVIILYVCRNSTVLSRQVHPSPACCRDACGANTQKRDLRRTLYCPLWTHRTAAASATPPVAGLSWVWSKSTRRRRRKRRRRAASRNSLLSGWAARWKTCPTDGHMHHCGRRFILTPLIHDSGACTHGRKRPLRCWLLCLVSGESVRSENHITVTQNFLAGFRLDAVTLPRAPIISQVATKILRLKVMRGVTLY